MDGLVRAIIHSTGNKATLSHMAMPWPFYSILLHHPAPQPRPKKMATSPITISPSSSSEYESPILLSSKDQVTGGSVQTIYKEDSSRQATCTFLLYTYTICIFSLHSESWPIDPSGRTDALLSGCLLEVAAHNAAGWMDGWIHGSIARSPSGSRGHAPQRVPVGGGAKGPERARSTPPLTELCLMDQWAGSLIRS